ncbi:hypothetical protein EBB79_23465 (plasmid) [Parasedimentitalea marina]|uniref:Transposase IS116/IS110/IS902 C-terminal domain-containing protein n=1 Tax=Parasedimentitalea marina TaxID=2483033 RepID=A0A3T0NA15_9RHOB|nr:hypothetical protein EBB79_23465 [Parasedimentitalea marina]
MNSVRSNSADYGIVLPQQHRNGRLFAERYRAEFVGALGFLPSVQNFRKGRTFAAWLSLVPRQHSTGGKDRFGRITNGSAHAKEVAKILGLRIVLRSNRAWLLPLHWRTEWPEGCGR